MARTANEEHFEAGKFKQNIKITMTVYVLNFTYKSYMPYTYHINSVEAIIEHQKFIPTSRALSTVALLCYVKIRENNLLQ